MALKNGNRFRFRAWDKKRQKMSYVWTLALKGWDGPDAEINYIEIERDGTVQVGEHEVILMQSTGLCDRGGGEIFEGDILAPNAREVLWLGLGPLYFGAGFYTQCHNPEYQSGLFTFGITQAEASRVAGNIYENPELLQAPRG